MRSLLWIEQPRSIEIQFVNQNQASLTGRIEFRKCVSGVFEGARKYQLKGNLNSLAHTLFLKTFRSAEH
jgi:hypothetical protein